MNMFKRKTCATFATSIVAPLLCLLWLSIFEGESITGMFSAYFFYAIYAIPLVLIYGLPVSCLSDFLTRKFVEARRIRVAFFIHVLFGLGFPFLFTLLLEPDLYQSGNLFNDITFFFVWGSTLSSFVFWAVDEYIRCKQTGREQGFSLNSCSL